MISGSEVVDERKQPLEGILAERVAEARAAYPWLTVVTDETFTDHVNRTAAPEAGAAELESLHVVDIMLVLGCLSHDSECLRQLDAQIGRVVAGIPGASRRNDTADLKQRVFQHVLLAAEGAPPKIVQYAGRAPLASWLRLVAARMHMASARRKQADLGLDVDGLACDFVAHDMELAQMRSTHADAFKKAFQEALSDLDPRDRTILRLSVLDGSSIDEIGLIYRVHRATAARWLAAIREKLFERTRAQFVSHGDLGVTEFRELAGVLLSRLDVSLGRMLDEGGVREAPPTGQE